MARVVTFDRLTVTKIELGKYDTDPVSALITYEIAGTNGEFASRVTFTPPSVPGNVQTQLENLWTLATNAARQREGL